ncbi:hypothetical protein I302_103675 [Kwoniella bestiolae CBS 10118]|uniref:Uncharacterized protein n=1 Tax=Kwoniella bestiolae CBS 10118 TaxID=1296100 RepID=A0A1B9G920_9TREE|nr:hypothetical protein I302_02380 [Kwoniella bestiolae CBS 10118]OCF27538.1 hypothetical protein I302_02380 [Kwoniella bestiolae CBS 10118]
MTYTPAKAVTASSQEESSPPDATTSSYTGTAIADSSVLSQDHSRSSSGDINSSARDLIPEDVIKSHEEMIQNSQLDPNINLNTPMAKFVYHQL